MSNFVVCIVTTDGLTSFYRPLYSQDWHIRRYEHIEQQYSIFRFCKMYTCWKIQECVIEIPTAFIAILVNWSNMMTSSNGNISALLAICAGNSPVPGEFPTQRPVTRSFDVFFDLRLNKRLSKQSWGWWFETLSRPLWRHRNEKASELGNG